MRLTEDRAHLQDPDIVSHELHTLILRTDSRMADAVFAAIIETVMDPVWLEEQRLRRHLFLARWGRQPITQWQDMDGRMVRRYAAVLADMLSEENRKAKEAADEARSQER